MNIFSNVNKYINSAQDKIVWPGSNIGFQGAHKRLVNTTNN